MKPKMFIGSSTETVPVAYAVQESLDRVVEITVWTQGIFELSRFTLDSLVEELYRSDFGVFVLSPDDIALMRGEDHKVARDNVIFELGLVGGKLGKEHN